MGIRWIAIAFVLAAAPALAEDGPRLQLASLAPPLGRQTLEQRFRDMSVRVPEPIEAGAVSGGEAKPVTPRRPGAMRAAKTQPGPLATTANAGGPASLDGVGTGYSLYFGRQVPATRDSGPERPGRPEAPEPALWTVLTGPSSGHAGMQSRPAAELDRPANLLFVLRAGF